PCLWYFLFSLPRCRPSLSLFPYTTLFRSPGVDTRLALAACPPLWPRGGHAIRQATGPDEERGVRIHAVLRAGGQALHLPLAHQRLPSARLSEAPQLPDALHHLHQLRDGAHVGHEHPARDQDVSHRLQNLPRLQHVQQDAVDLAHGLAGGLLDVAQAHVPVLRLPTHDVVDVAHRVIQVILADFVADDLPVLTDRA